MKNKTPAYRIRLNEKINAERYLKYALFAQLSRVFKKLGYTKVHIDNFDQYIFNDNNRLHYIGNVPEVSELITLYRNHVNKDLFENRWELGKGWKFAK